MSTKWPILITAAFTYSYFYSSEIIATTEKLVWQDLCCYPSSGWHHQSGYLSLRALVTESPRIFVTWSIISPKFFRSWSDLTTVKRWVTRVLKLSGSVTLCRVSSNWYAYLQTQSFCTNTIKRLQLYENFIFGNVCLIIWFSNFFKDLN